MNGCANCPSEEPLSRVVGCLTTLNRIQFAPDLAHAPYFSAARISDPRTGLFSKFFITERQCYVFGCLVPFLPLLSLGTASG